MLRERNIVIIGVIYNTYPETLRYITSLEKYPGDKFLLILADNSETLAPGSFLEEVGKHDFIEYIRTGSNLGYFHGAQFGLTHYLSAFGKFPEWIFVTNVDIVFQDPLIFQTLEKYEPGSRLGVVAPSIISGRWQTDFNPKIRKRYAVKQLKFYRQIYASFIFQNIYIFISYIKKFLLGFIKKSKHYDIPSRHAVEKIYAPHGSCIIFHRNYFEKGGTLNHISFLFGEEIFVAETASSLNLDIIYEPGIKIDDHEHASTSYFVSRKMNRYYRQSIEDILMHYYPEARP